MKKSCMNAIEDISIISGHLTAGMRNMNMIKAVNMGLPQLTSRCQHLASKLAFRGPLAFDT